MTGRPSAIAGVLSIGTFTLDNIGPLTGGQDGHKIWVASQRKGRDDAVLQITDPRGEVRMERRRSGESWVANAEQFYAGSLRTEVGGLYRLHVTVGLDSICVKVRYRSS